MTKILITGVTGFLGRYLADKLTGQGYEVVGISTKMADKSTYQCNLQDKMQIMKVVQDAQPDIVIHCAALSSVTRGEVLDYYINNVLATENLIEAVNTTPSVNRFLFISTAGVYGNQDCEVLTELLPPNPVSHYGYSKLICERLCTNNLTNPDMCTIIRPFNIVGSGQNEDFIVPKLIRHFKVRAPEIKLGNINTIRDYIDIYSACDIISELMISQESYGKIVNLCSGVGLSVGDLISRLEKISDHKIKVVVDEKFIRKNEVWKLLGDTEILQKCVKSFNKKTNTDISGILEEMLYVHNEREIV